MGGVVSDVVGGIGDAVSGVGNAVGDILSSDVGKAAALAAGAYYGAPFLSGSLGGAGALDTMALGDMAATGAGGGLTAGGLGTGLSGATAAQAAVNAAGGSTLGNLANGAINWASSNPLQAVGLGLTAASALGSSTPTSSTTTTSIDPEVKAAYLRNLEEARGTAANLGPKQFAAFPEYNLGMVQKYFNPYESQVVQGALSDIERARQMQISQEGAQATAAKAFGGSRQGVTRSLVDEAALRNAGNLAAQLRQQGFSQAQNLGLSQEALRQQYEQSKLDAARNLGLERLNVAQGALSLQPANIGSSQTTPLYRNTSASALGGALGGASLGKLIGGTANPEYAGYGAGLGGILGLLG
jgi:hypothetical protein